MLRYRWLTMIAAGVISLLVGGMSWAGNFKDISAQTLKTKLDRGEPLVVVNPLSDIEFDQQHIPGSINIPLHLISTTDRLPRDKSTPIVTYCLGPK